MKILLWILSITAIAVGFTLAAQHNVGTVLLLYPPYRVELSLNLFVVLMLLFLLLGYALLRLLRQIVSLPSYVQAFRRTYGKKRARAAMNDALAAYFEGRYVSAEKNAVVAMEKGEAPELNALLAARAAHRAKNNERCDYYLAAAEKTVPRPSAACLITQAEIFLEQSRAAETLIALGTLGRAAAKQPHVLRLKLVAYQATENWEQVLTTAAQMEKQGIVSSDEARVLKTEAFLSSLMREANDLDALAKRWKKIPVNFRIDATIAHAAACAFNDAGDEQMALEIVSLCLEKTWERELVLLYSRFIGNNALKQIERAEKWLNVHPTDDTLLLSLGRLCMEQSLWGKAQSYLEASISVKSTPEAHFILAKLMEKMGQTAEACKHYQQSLPLQTSLPVDYNLTRVGALPTKNASEKNASAGN